MQVARFSIDNPLITWLLILGALFGGLWGFSSLGRLEDPAFTIKQAVIITTYAGASAEQVAREVTEPLESSIQKMDEIKRITSINSPGQSLIELEILDTIAGSKLPEVWTKLRHRVADTARSLPSGVGEPLVNDTFGDVFGVYYAVISDGFTDAEKHQLATFLRRELLTVDGVADVEVAGLPDEAIFVEPNMALSASQKISPQVVLNAIVNSNSVVDGGAVESGITRTIIRAPDGTDSVSAIAGLSIGVGGEVVNLVDVAEVKRARVENPNLIIRFNSTDAFTLGVAGLSEENIVEVGQRTDAKLAQLKGDIPYGVEIHPIYQQHLVVEKASNDFLVNLSMSISIVVFVLTVAMGWRAAIVVGTTLLLSVVGTLFFMAIFSIEMERISLGALIIAMGMLVDNAIVVAEGMKIAMQRGKSSREAADEVAGKTQIPLLGATVIGIMAFAGIGLSPDSTGEFLFSLFAVICISLLLSWVLALTVTPLFGHYFFVQGTSETSDSYSGLLFRGYGRLLKAALTARWLVIAGLMGITALCFVGFGQIKQQFFPDSNTPLFFVHYKLPQGTSIRTTSAHLAEMEAWLSKRDDVVSVASFAGQGASRFLLTYSAEKSNASYGHLIIRTKTLEEIPPLQADLEVFGNANFPEGEFRTARLVFGPGSGSPIEVRFSGSDPAVLRQLGDEAISRMAAASDNVRHLRTNWREQELVIKPVYATERAKKAGVSRDDLANTFLYATEGIKTGVYRENERLIPIVVRLAKDSDLTLFDQIVYSSGASASVPVDQVIDGMTYEIQNTLVHRRDRVPTLTVSAGVPIGMTAAEVRAEIVDTIEAIDIPSGYALEWGGEYENSQYANASLANQLPISLLVMVLISVLLFNALKQPIIIWLLVPMSVNGVVIGLLGTGYPFTFTALLGMLSLSGMLIKNGIVLVEEIDLIREEGYPLREAITKASVSRLRPIVLAAATTILGMIPLLGDAFFVSMAVTIMGGLTFASVLTLVAVPVLYCVFFERSERKVLLKANEDPVQAS